MENNVKRQSVEVIESGKNIILASVKTMKNGARREDKITLSPKNIADLKATAKKDANAFNDKVTALAGQVKLDSKAEKAGLCKHARTKTLQARIAKMLGVEANVKKTNAYLRETAPKKVKKVAVKK